MTTELTTRNLPIDHVKPVNYTSILSTLAVAVLALVLLRELITNKAFEWNVVAEFFASDAILTGVVRTLWLTVLCMAIACVIGLLLCALRLSRYRALRSVSAAYVWFFRGTPLLVQLIFWYNLGYLYKHIRLSVFGWEVFSVETNMIVGAWFAGIVGLSLHEASYLAEIFRGGIVAVDSGQTLAAKSLGMSKIFMYRRVILPQAAISIVPNASNILLMLLKNTSLFSVVALPELMYTAQLIYTETFKTVPLLVVACLWYLIVVTVFSVLQTLLEKRYSRGHSRSLAAG